MSDKLPQWADPFEQPSEYKEMIMRCPKMTDEEKRKALKAVGIPFDVEVKA